MAKEKVWRRFKLLHGVHQQRDRDGVQRVYKRGDVFESCQDLESLGRDKFQDLSKYSLDDSQELRRRIAELEAQLAVARSSVEEEEEEEVVESEAEEEEELPPLVLPENLPYMTVDELKKFASDNNVDLGSATKKSDILAILKSYAAD